MYGLIGYPLSHSFSPTYFKNKFERENIPGVSYDLYPFKSLKGIRRKVIKDLKGFNVTIPYKELIIPYLDFVDPKARKVGAVNTVKIVDGKWYGYNTDVIGFGKCLSKFLGQKKVTSAMVLGSGGAAKAICHVLRQKGIRPRIISRKRGYKSYKNLSREFLSAHRLIINTTPLGMSPQIDKCPSIPYDLLTSKHLLFDLIYNPKKTLFLKKGENQGATIMNGQKMLEYQADASWTIWNEEPQNKTK